MMAEKMVVCDDCAMTGFIDKVRREILTMDPREMICPTCRGRGWVTNPDIQKKG